MSGTQFIIYFGNYYASDTPVFAANNTANSWKINGWMLSFTRHKLIKVLTQRAKKAVADSPGLVDFAIRLVNSVFNLPNSQLMFFEELEWQKNCEINSACQKAFGASWNDVWSSKW